MESTGDKVKEYLTGTIAEILEFNYQNPQHVMKKRGRHHMKEDCSDAIKELIERRKNHVAVERK